MENKTEQLEKEIGKLRNHLTELTEKEAFDKDKDSFAYRDWYSTRDDLDLKKAELKGRQEQEQEILKKWLQFLEKLNAGELNEVQIRSMLVSKIERVKESLNEN